MVVRDGFASAGIGPKSNFGFPDADLAQATRPCRSQGHTQLSQGLASSRMIVRLTAEWI